ncbi:hypothetical protein niasHT_014401 [Heterodera trifolii]|uniref:BRCT domain-containing protein n=1 Tax=Heterodera trifolii TaxID=157864 RepID=A0ABD2LJQ9_9BILA
MSDNIDFQNEIREMLRGINQKIDLCNERIDTLHQDMAVIKSVAAMKSEKDVPCTAAVETLDQEEKNKKESSGPSEVEHAQNNMENVPEKYLPETETKGLTFTVAIGPIDQEEKKDESVTDERESRADKEELSGPSEVEHAQNNMENVPEKYLPETETEGLTFTVAIGPIDQEEKKEQSVTDEREPRADKEESSGPSEVEHAQNNMENVPEKYLPETETEGLTFTVAIGPIDQEEKKEQSVTDEREPRADKEELSGPSEVEHAQNDVENMPENYLPGDKTETKGPTFTVAIGPIDQEEKKEESVTSHKTPPILAGCQSTASGFMGTDMNVSSKESTIELDRKMVFRDVIVMFTGLNKAKRDELTSIVVKLGGKVCRTVKEDFTHLITEKCDPNSEKYDFARRLKLPVLRPSWLHAAVEANGFEELNAVLTHSIMNSHKTPLLGGCQITASGFMGTDRVKIGRLIELHGGLFTGQMSRATCTHLIAAASSGEKYRRAHEWGTVKVVTSEWLFKCDKTGYRLREDHFLLNSDGEKRRSSADIEWNTTEGQRNTTKDERKENMKPATKKMKVDMKLMKNEH